MKTNNVIITNNGNNIYTLETKTYKCVGYYEKISNNMTKVNLIKWYDKNTKRYKTYKNKLYNHTLKWFAYMLEKYKEA